MVKSVEYLSILEIDLHFPPQVRLSDLCTLWCHGEYYDRSLLALKGKWCFDNLYISNWLFETPHWFLTEGPLIGYCAFIFDSYISSPCNVSPCCYSNQRANYILDIYTNWSSRYIHLPKGQMNWIFFFFRLTCSHPSLGFWRL